MRMILRLVLVCALALPLATAEAADAPAGGQPPLTVVELFTSQGCSSCPPADALLSRLAEREDVIALSMHVDYWDYIGWKDPFASPVITERQRDYAASLGGRYVYTPQMVIQGTAEAVGSNARNVEWRIKEARKLPRVTVGLTADIAADKVTVSLPPAETMESHTVLLAVYDDEKVMDVLRGENGGRRLKYSHVVRELRRIGTWRGEATEIPLRLSELRAKDSDAYACAVLLQSMETGRIIGAAKIELNQAR